MNKEQMLAQTLYKTQYGSRLYGTNGPKSDTDWKFLFLPRFNDVLLGRQVQKGKFTSPNLQDKTLQVDEDFVALQKFAVDFLNGVPAAVETAYSAFGNHAEQECMHVNFAAFVSELTDKFANKKLSGFFGFFDHKLKEARQAYENDMDMDSKEAYHGVRVGMQLVELLETGRLVYPFPPNVCRYLLELKEGNLSTKQMFVLLQSQHENLVYLKNATGLREHTPQLEAEFETWFTGWLRVFYNLPSH